MARSHYCSFQHRNAPLLPRLRGDEADGTMWLPDRADRGDASMMIMKIAGAAMMAGVAGLFAAGHAPAAIASQTHTRTIASCVVQGDRPKCVVTGHVSDPVAISLHITARPRQHFSGSESVACSRAGQGVGSVGLLSGRTPFRERLFGRW